MKMKINGPAFLAPWEGRKVFLREAHENGLVELIEEEGTQLLTFYGRIYPAGTNMPGRLEIQHQNKRIFAKFSILERIDLVTEDKTFDLRRDEDFTLGPIVEFT